MVSMNVRKATDNKRNVTPMLYIYMYNVVVAIFLFHYPYITLYYPIFSQ